MIYVIRIKGTDLVKIGYTKSQNGVRKRKVSLEIGNPYELVIEATFPGTQSKERCLHHFCIARHVRGEWFRLTDDEVRRMVAKYHDWKPSQDGVRKVSCISHTVRNKKRGKKSKAGIRYNEQEQQQ